MTSAATKPGSDSAISHLNFLLRPENWNRLTLDQRATVEHCVRAIHLQQRQERLQRDLENREEEKGRLLSSFAYFFRRSWEWAQDERLVWNWHHDLMASYLQALQAGRLFSDLIINVPPGSTKSICASIIWPAWCFAKNPSERFLEASYDDTLVKDHSLKCRNLIESEWYQEFFGDRVQVSNQRRQAGYWETTAGGYRLSTTPGGRATGRHPSIILYDDILSVAQADSQRLLETVNDWHDKTMASRGAAKSLNRRRCNLQQRLAFNDMSGHLMKSDVWARLVIPMEYEPDRMPDIGLGADPRSKTGELMWPEMFPEKIVAELKRSLGDKWWGQYQQRPVADTGGTFKVDRLKIVPRDEVPWGELERIKRAWDFASTRDAGCYTAGILGGIVELDQYRIRIYILDVLRKQWSSDEVQEQVELWTRLDERKFGSDMYEMIFEQEPGASGVQAANETLRRLRGFQARSIKAKTKKQIRWTPFANSIARYEVYLVEAPWNADYVSELRQVPKGEYVDQVDASSLLYSELIAKDKFTLPADDDESGVALENCCNKSCDRMARVDGPYCCECCRESDEAGSIQPPDRHEIHCNQRHNDLYVQKLWVPASQIQR